MKMENKTKWYKKLLRKLNKIKSGKLDLDEYIHEVEAKIEAQNQALSMSGVVGRSESVFCDCKLPAFIANTLTEEVICVKCKGSPKN